jgi:hypothetical protein
MLGPTNRATYTTTNPSERSGLHEPRELGQGLGASHARITQAPELDHMPPCPLEVGIGKRAGLIERAAMAVVARVEAVLGHKLRSGIRRKGRACFGELPSRNRYGEVFVQMRGVDAARVKMGRAERLRAARRSRSLFPVLIG